MLGHKTPEGNHLLGIYKEGCYRQQHGEALQAVADLLETYEKRDKIFESQASGRAAQKI